MLGIYLAAGKALHNNYNLIYQDILGDRDIGGDMMDIDLSNFDFIIASPPCNFWSRARGKTVSDYSLNTYHLLPDIIDKLIAIGKPFIVENVRNSRRFIEYNLFDKNCHIYFIGRHTYWTNVNLGNIHLIKQRQDFLNHGYVIKYDDLENCYHQGGYNVYQVIEKFLTIIHKSDFVVESIEKLKLF